MNTKYPIDIFINHKREGKEAAIRKALNMVKTEAIVFSDADAILDTNCVKQLVNTLMKENIEQFVEGKFIQKLMIKVPAKVKGYFINMKSLLKKD